MSLQSGRFLLTAEFDNPAASKKTKEGGAGGGEVSYWHHHMAHCRETQTKGLLKASTNELGATQTHKQMLPVAVAPAFNTQSRYCIVEIALNFVPVQVRGAQNITCVLPRNTEGHPASFLDMETNVCVLIS